MKKTKNLTIVVNAQTERLIKHLPKGKASQIFNHLLIESVRSAQIYELLLSFGEIEAARGLYTEWERINGEVGHFRDAIKTSPLVEPLEKPQGTAAESVVIEQVTPIQELRTTEKGVVENNNNLIPKIKL